MSRITVWAATGAATAALAAGGLVMFAPTGDAATASGPSECKVGDVSASFKSTDAAMSHRYGRLALTNVSDDSCWIKGYGGLSYVGGSSGTQVGAPADRTPSATPKTVLAPGDRVTSLVSAAVAEVYPTKTCEPTPVDGFRVYIPDETHSLFVKHRTTGCANPSVHLLDHKAFR